MNKKDSYSSLISRLRFRLLAQTDNYFFPLFFIFFAEFRGFHKKFEFVRRFLVRPPTEVRQLDRRPFGRMQHFHRLTDMVISGGLDIYPREVEEVIFQHPGVLEAAVIGIPDEKWGEALKAFVVLRPGEDVGADGLLAFLDLPGGDEGDLIGDGFGLLAFLESRISRMKLPKHVEFIGQIPRNANGKVLKTALRARS